MRGIKIRVGRYKWLFVAIFLLHIVTLVFLSNTDYFYFRSQQAHDVNPDGEYAIVELPYADEVIRKLVEHPNITDKYNFFVEYQQNIPANPLATIYLTWENASNIFNFPIRKENTPETTSPTISMGNNSYQKLTAEQQKKIEINQQEFEIQYILGEKGVKLGAFDDVTIIDGKTIDFDFVTYIPQNRYMTLYFLNQGNDSVEILLNQLGIESSDIHIENTRGLPLELFANERMMNNQKIIATTARELMPTFIILGIAVFVIAIYFINQSQYENLIQRILGMTNQRLIGIFIKNNFVMMLLILVLVLMLQKICIYLDIGILFRIRPSSYYIILIEQVIIQLLFLTLFIINNIKKPLIDVNKKVN